MIDVSLKKEINQMMDVLSRKIMRLHSRYLENYVYNAYYEKRKHV